MSVPTPEHLPSRRAVLLATAAGLTSACTTGGAGQDPSTASPTDDGQPGPTPSREARASSTSDPDRGVRRRAVAAERALLARYAAVLAAHPQLANRLAQVVADHEAHLARLLGTGAATTPAAPPPATPASAATPMTTAPATSTATPAVSATPTATVPAQPGVALRALVAAERTAATDRIEDTLAATAALAPLLASIGGSEAAHAATLLVGR